MLTDEEITAIWSSTKNYDTFARDIERAVLAKALAQQERLHKEWSELWSPIDEAVRPLTPLGESVAAKAIELINAAKAMPIPKQEPVGYVVIGKGISFYRTTKEEAEYQANALEWRDEREPAIHPVYMNPFASDKNDEEVWFRPVDLPEYPKGTYLIRSYKGVAGGIGPFYSHPQPAQAAAIPEKVTVSQVPHSQYAQGWNDCIDAALSASPKPE